MSAKKQVFALIGGIASGKTAASEIFARLGARIIDADIISREVTAAGTEGEKKLIERFPECVCDGKIDRRLLRKRVFSDEKERLALNAITHPLILKEIGRQVAEADGTVIVVMPLPIGLNRYAAVLGVYAPVEKRIERLKKRDNIDEQLARSIISAQMSDEQVEKVSDFTFVNDGEPEELERSIVKWWSIYVEK